MADYCRVDVDALTNDQREIQLTDNQGTKPETKSNAQEISSDNDQANDVRRDEQLLDRLVIKGKKNNKSGTQIEQHRKIGWLPQLLWKNEQYRTPIGLSIGPFNYERCYSGGVENFKVKNEEVIVKLAAKFIESFSDDKTGKSLLNQIRNNDKELRKCFHERAIRQYDNGTLARFFFLEGCAVLEFIHSYPYKLDEFGIDNYQARVFGEDLFLLQNQIPFRVLELLIDLTSKPDQLKEDIVNFLYLNKMMEPLDDMCGRKQWNDILMIKKQNLHLLDLLHSLIISGYEDVTTGNNNGKDDKIRYLPCCYDQQKNNCCLPRFSCFHRKRPTSDFRYVQELKSAGIDFEPCSSLATISFSSKCFNMRGQLKLPSLTVDKWTERKLMNLVAHEMCLAYYDKSWYFVMSYLKLMDFLIDKEQDVKELRGSQILWNRLSSDVEVAKLFNDMGSKFSEPRQDKYSNVKTEIQTHCKRNCAVWMAQFYQQHFSSPWTVVALLAAGLVISLTFVQTWYAVHPKN